MNKFLLLKDNFLIERECNFLINLHKANIKNTKKHPTGNGHTTVLPISKGLDKKIDELNGIERKPLIGLLISVIGTVLFWSLIYWLWVSLY